MTKEIASPYDELASSYNSYAKTRFAYLQAVDRLVLNQLNHSDHLLDVGSGDGHRIKSLSQKSGITKLDLLEPSIEMAKLCEKITGRTVHNCEVQTLHKLDLPEFDVVTALWNVFGHIMPARSRKEALLSIRNILRQNGKLIFDVNNRHNARAYGRMEVARRIVVDKFCFEEQRGDASYNWEVDGKSIPAKGHLFTYGEVKELVIECGFTITHYCTVDYLTGQLSNSKTKGQHFFVLNRD